MKRKEKLTCENCGAHNRSVVWYKVFDDKMPRTQWCWCKACHEAYRSLRKADAGKAAA